MVERVQDECQVPVWGRSARPGVLRLKLVDPTGEEVLICQAVASDLLQCVDDGGVVSGNSHRGKVLGREKKVKKSVRMGVVVEKGSCPASLHHSVKMRHLLS